MLKLIAINAMVTAIAGSVHNNSLRRPKVSMVQIAGKAPRKLIRPNITDAQRADGIEFPGPAKIVEE